MQAAKMWSPSNKSGWSVSVLFLLLIEGRKQRTANRPVRIGSPSCHTPKLSAFLIFKLVPFYFTTLQVPFYCVGFWETARRCLKLTTSFIFLQIFSAHEIIVPKLSLISFLKRNCRRKFVLNLCYKIIVNSFIHDQYGK